MTSDVFLTRLRTETFWDTELTQVDPQRHGRFIIRRVMDRGTRQEVSAVNTFYSQEQIAEALLTARTLDPKTIAYFSAVFDLPKEAFRAVHSCPVPSRSLSC